MSNLPVSQTTALPPMTNPDGTRSAIVAAPPRLLNESAVLAVRLPGGLGAAGVNGRYFLARCGVKTEEERWSQWQIYLRRPLFGIHLRPGRVDEAGDLWELHLPLTGDPGYRWLLEQPVGQMLNLLGPFGRGFTLHAHSRNLLLLADATRAPLLFALSDAMLDQGGRVTLLVQGTSEAVDTLMPLLPIPVEVRQATDHALWAAQIGELTPWADQICVALPIPQLSTVAALIRQQRFRTEASFAQALIEADLVCGVGACLACIVPVRDAGYTRACMHGPVMGLLELYG